VPRVSVKQVAAHAGVSLGTVSNVLNRPERVREETRDRVLAAIKELGFVRNDAARQLRAGSSRSIGLLVLDTTNPFFMALARGADRAALRHGYTLLLGNTDESAEREGAYLDLFQQQQVAGTLITPVSTSDEHLKTLTARGLPTVLVDQSPGEIRGLSAVSVDDRLGARLAVEHLLSLGRDHLVFLGGPSSIPQVRDRTEGARAAVDAAQGVDLRIVNTEHLTIEDGFEAGLELLKDTPPDAVFAANDLLAIGFMRAVQAHGEFSIPEDIAVVGYDDIPYAPMLQIPLTSIHQPAEQLGEAAVEMLLGGGLGDDPHETFEPQLVIRSSTVSAAGT
jgi:LacI family transcriptional regulator